MRKMMLWTCLASVLIALVALSPGQEPRPKPTPLNAPPRLRVTLPWGLVVSYPVEMLWAGPSISTTQFASLLRDFDRDAEVEWDASTGVLNATVDRHQVSLFLRERTLIFDKAALDVDQRLIEARGQIYITLNVLDTVLARFEHVETNIESLLKRYRPEEPQMEESAPQPSLVDPGASDVEPVDSRALQEMLRVWSGRDDIALARIETDLRLVAGPLASRKTIVLDPRVLSDSMVSRVRTEEVIPDPPDLTLQIARRTSDLLADHPAVKIVLTREDGSTPTPAERVEAVNTSGAKALVTLALSWSEFPEIGGYQLYTIHQAVDPQGLELGSRMYRSPELGARLESAYIPYQHMSLVLSR
ncbi:MAG: hypothetical protein ACOC2L_00260, partial [Candidatus Sumerlaeota bacterium]